jgi:cytoskeletal protein RodZ
MSNTVVWIIVAVVVVLLLILVAALFARSARDRKHTAEADRIRDDVREQSTRVEKREAIAAETDAKARAAAAEAEAKAAEAARLTERASTHRNEAASSREHLDAELDRADGMDPRLKDDGKRDDVDDDDDKIKRDEVNGSEQEAPHRIVN